MAAALLNSPINHHIYDFICFGDELPGILTLVCAVREYYRQTRRYPHALLLCKRGSQEGIGGQLVRGKLGCLDRHSLDRPQSNFTDPPAIYQEFLRRSGTDGVPGGTIDPDQADGALRQLLKESSIDILSHLAIQSVLKQGRCLTGLELTTGTVCTARQFIDATVNAELAQLAGSRKLPGFASLGLPTAELPVTLVFETTGLSIQHLQAIEWQYLERFQDSSDREAQTWLHCAAGGDRQKLQQLRKILTKDWQQHRTMLVEWDAAIVRSPALSIAYHGWRGTKFAIEEVAIEEFATEEVAIEVGQISFDLPKIARLPGDRLLWQALCLTVTADQAETLANSGARPTAALLQEMMSIEQWLLQLGATTVKPASELWIRHAGNVTGIVNPLSGAKMLAGGVLRREALGTVGHSLSIPDTRASAERIVGLAERAATCSMGPFNCRQFLRFNIGIQHALLRTIPNLAIVSPAAGFAGCGCIAGRSMELNVAVGQGVGIACALAVLSDRQVNQIVNPEVRLVLEQTATLSDISDDSDAIASERMHEFETCMAAGTSAVTSACSLDR